MSAKKEKPVVTNADLRNDLLNVYNEIRAKKMSVDEGQSLANVAKAVLLSAREQRIYQRQKTKPIDFFEEPNK
jgi:hypothetical protein